MAVSFAHLGYRNASNLFDPVNLRAQDVVAISGESVEAHMQNITNAHGADQAASANSIARRVAGGALVIGAPRAGTAGANDAVRRTDMDTAISGVVGGLQFQGSWDAATNTPTLPTTPAVQGQYWIATTAGTQFGLTFAIGDWCVAGATTWTLVPVTAAVQGALDAHINSTAAHTPQNVGAIPVTNIGAATGGTLPVARGGTNRTSQATGNMNYATSTTATGVVAAPSATVAQALVHPVQAVATPAVWRALTGATSLRNDMGLGTGSGMLTNTDIGLGNVANVPQAAAARLINTNAPLTGGGNLTADRTLGINAASAATTTANGAAGSAVYAADNNTTARNLAATPAGVASQVANIANSVGSVITSATLAGTAAKEATLAGFVRRAGSIVWVRFSAANTATSPTLNVNATGAAPIWVDGQVMNTANLARQINANVTYGFIFDGTNWNMIVPATNKPTMGLGWGTMATAAATAAKVGTLAGFIRRTGSMIALRWDTTPTAMTTLNVNSTGAVNVFHAGVRIQTTANNLDMVVGGRTYFFVFDGTQWQLLNPAIEAQAPLDAAFVPTEAAMQALNLRTGALVLMEVQNVSIGPTSEELEPLNDYSGDSELVLEVEGEEGLYDIDTEKEGDDDE